MLFVVRDQGLQAARIDGKRPGVSALMAQSRPEMLLAAAGFMRQHLAQLFDFVLVHFCLLDRASAYDR